MGLIHSSAEIDPAAVIDSSAYVWGLTQVRAGASIGADAIIGRGCYIGSGVVVGARVKIQNAAMIYEPASVGDGAFIGPGAILTNDRNPRSTSPTGDLKEPGDWTRVGVIIGRGASIGAGAICVAPLEVGEWSMVGAGSVVTSNVRPFALVVGTPARQIGWVGRAGFPLVKANDGVTWNCPSSPDAYEERTGMLRLID